jgi:hypothetical protein
LLLSAIEWITIDGRRSRILFSGERIICVPTLMIYANIMPHTPDDVRVIHELAFRDVEQI